MARVACVRWDTVTLFLRSAGLAAFLSFLVLCRDGLYGSWGFRGFGKHHRLGDVGHIS
jgi:hypothetical protein